MRVPNISLYNTSSFRLNVITNDLKNASEVVSTTKQINAISDDPIGLSQVLDLRATIDNLAQFDKNIDLGITWINTTESALGSASDQLLNAKLLCLQLANASVSASERADAVETIEGIIDQMLALGNTKINGSYVFSGTKSNVVSFTYDDTENPTRVIYNGSNTAFSVKTGDTGTLDVGSVGLEVFTEEAIVVDSTNHTLVFREDPGMGEDFKQVIKTTVPDGTYTPDELAIVVRNAMNSASEEYGYGITYKVDHDAVSSKFTISDDGTYDGYFQFDLLWETGCSDSESGDNSIGPDLGFNLGDVSCAPPQSDSQVALKIFDPTNNVIDFKEDTGSGFSSQLSAAIPQGAYYDMADLAGAVASALEDASINNIDYEVTYSEETCQFTIRDAGGTLTSLQLLWNSGTHATLSAAGGLGYDISADGSGALTYSSDSAVALFTIARNVNDTINFKEILPGSGIDQTGELTATIAAGTYTDLGSFTSAVEDALEDASEQNGNRIDYNVSYSDVSHRFTIREDGDQGKKLASFELLWGSGTGMSRSAASVLGFDAEDVSASPAEGEAVDWGIFETLFALKGYLASDDVEGISRSITRLDTHYGSITSTLSEIGIRYNRLEVTQQISAEAQSSLTERKSMIEDADIVEAIMNLTAIQTAYEASLSSTSKIINLSLVDYL